MKTNNSENCRYNMGDTSLNICMESIAHSFQWNANSPSNSPVAALVGANIALILGVTDTDSGFCMYTKCHKMAP